MTTLIAVYGSDGLEGRCDARCYDSDTSRCRCVCRGKNHGVGKQRATDNTRELAAEWIDRWRAEHPGQELRFEVDGHRTEQGSLFANA